MNSFMQTMGYMTATFIITYVIHFVHTCYFSKDQHPIISFIISCFEIIGAFFSLPIVFLFILSTYRTADIAISKYKEEKSNETDPFYDMYLKCKKENEELHKKMKYIDLESEQNGWNKGYYAGYKGGFSSGLSYIFDKFSDDLCLKNKMKCESIEIADVQAKSGMKDTNIAELFSED